MSKITYRPGEKRDAPEISSYIELAAGGIIEFLYHDLVPDVTPVQMLAKQVEDEKICFSYSNTHVAVRDRKIIGIANSYPAANNPTTKELEPYFPKERLDLLQETFNSPVEGSFFLNSLAVAAEYRRQGIGTKLMEITKQKAKERGFSSLSLTVWADNSDAISLYQGQGFGSVKSIHVGLHPMLPHNDGIILMNCQLGPIA